MALIEGLQTKVEPIKIYIWTYSLQCTFLRNKIEDVQVHTRCMMRTWVIHCPGECVFLGAGVCIRCTYKHWTIHGVLGVCHERRQINWNIIAQTTQSLCPFESVESEKQKYPKQVQNKIKTKSWKRSKISFIKLWSLVISIPVHLSTDQVVPLLPQNPHNFIIILVSQ